MSKGMNKLIISAVLFVSILSFNQAFALSITGYDVSNAEPSGFCNWFHYYTGTIATNGGLANYSEGSGTMNNGIIETSTSSTQLFDPTVYPSITLYLDGYYYISEIDIFGGDIIENGIHNGNPGLLTGWTVSIGDTSVDYESTPFGEIVDFWGDLVNDQVILNETQQSILTNKIILNNFETHKILNRFSIAEIEVNGENPSLPVPEPATMLLLGSGLVGIAGFRKRLLKK